ncbi:MAG: hypothetical protein N2688_00485 [Burkholderiaceae bacterium]|nr:hypothetical protein [Burkholderiaceae bacterium]
MPWIDWVEKHAIKLGLLLWLVIALSLLLTGCVSLPPVPPQAVQPPQLPSLPLEARQPPAPAFCSPTCSAGVERELSSWQSMLTGPLPREPPASAPTRP